MTTSTEFHYWNGEEWISLIPEAPEDGVAYARRDQTWVAAVGLTAPASASDTGFAGELRTDGDYLYVCIAEDTWKRVAIATW